MLDFWSQYLNLKLVVNCNLIDQEMSLTRSGTDLLGLSLTGLRMGPRDPATHAPKVGIKQEVIKPENSPSKYQARIMKERSGFSGGFKIPDEFRKSKQKKKGLFSDMEQEEEGNEGTQGQSMITKDEIFQQLNLGHSESGIGVGKHGTNSKTAIAKDLVEGIEKDLEKYKRQLDNISLRKHLAMTGQSLVEETEEEKQRELEARLKSNLEQNGAFVIAASPKKLQVMRHQASQLASIKNLTIEELEDMKTQNERRLKELEEIYMRKKENSQVGKIIRERMGLHSSEKPSQETPREEHNEDEEEEEGKLPPKKGKKSVKILDGNNKEDDEAFPLTKGNSRVGGKENAFGAGNQVRLSAGGPKFSSKGGDSRSPQRTSTATFPRNGSRGSGKRGDDSPVYDSPRQKLYEAKFEKYLANKEQKLRQEKKLEKLKKEDFEIFMRGPDSPSKKASRFSKERASAKYDSESLIPADYNEQLIQKKAEEVRSGAVHQSNSKDPFKRLGVSNEDKMTFFLLKWIFNAIKRDSAAEDTKLMGKPYVTKVDLVKQLAKNDELMSALGYDGPEEVTAGVKKSVTAKEGCLLWEEFLDFFFMRQMNLEKPGAAFFNKEESWWRRIGHSEPKPEPAKEDANKEVSPPKPKNVPRYGSQAGNQQQTTMPYNYEDPDKKPVKMTESLKMLQETRRGKVVTEVEEEFKATMMQQQAKQKSLAASALPNAAKKKSVGFDTMGEMMNEDEEEQLQFGFKREKSELRLLQSQIAIMQEIFESLDKYNDGILRRSQLIMALRTDERVVEFIDADAVKVPEGQRVLTLDEVFIEIEKDEMYETAQMGKQANQINHKEFITWREFMTYFNDYREIEDRNKKAKEIQKTRQKLQKERKEGTDKAGSEDEADQLTSLMEKEKQHRLQELPKLRPADQIDISEKQLQLLRDVYDSQSKVPGKDAVYTIDFFLTTRKNPQLRAISSAIARDPEGYSRLPRETFQQVFDRMESEIQGKEIEWATIVEYFTKRGRPLTKEEVTRLIEEDKRQRQDEEARRRNEEEAERRRVARLMEDLDGDQDFEAFELKEKEKEQQPAERKLNFADEGLSPQYGHNDSMDHEDGEDDDDDDIDREGAGYQSDPELGTAKRSIKFRDGGISSPSNNRKVRAQSAKSRNGRGGADYSERDLRNTKLTTGDYIEHERSKSAKRGKYGVTVPRPFNFEMREKSRSKTIRERKVEEMVNEKKNEELTAIKYQFRPNPIPPEVLIPRYKTIMEGNMMRRLEVKKNSIALTKANEKPFSFYEREKLKQKPDPEEYLPYDLKKPGFKANPIPRACSVLIFDQMMKQQEQERQERIRKQAELNFSKAKLPERMQMHSEKQKQLPPKRADSFDNFNFRPKINELVTREQFKKAQDKFNSKLQKKKAQQQTTQPRSPNFTKTSQKTLEREYLNEKDAVGGTMDKLKQALMKKMHSFNGSAGGEPDKAQNPSSTKSMTLAMLKRREELEKKRKMEEERVKEDQDRIDKQNRMKNTVQAALKDRIKDDTEKRQQAIEDKKRKQRQEEKEVKAKIQQSKDRARARPLLIDSVFSKKHGENLAKIRATKAFIQILEDKGLNPKEHLNAEQKELLAESEFIEKKKRELGKL